MLFPFILDGGGGASLPFFMFVVMTIACLCLSVVIGASSNDIPAGKPLSHNPSSIMAFVTSPISTATTTKTKLSKYQSLVKLVRTMHHRTSLPDNTNEHIQHQEEGSYALNIQQQEGGSYSLLSLAAMNQLSLQSYNPLHPSMATGDQSLVERHLRLGIH